jgi:hypothetical protein
MMILHFLQIKSISWLSLLEYDLNSNVNLIGTFGGSIVRVILINEFISHWTTIRLSYIYIL